MLEVVQNLGLGFSVALSPPLLLYAFVGCVIGTLVGVLPGVGPLAGISLLLPATFGMDATRAIVMLAGIYYGAMYGGSTTSILMRIPGEAASVMTCIDGYAMARKGLGVVPVAVGLFGVAEILATAGAQTPPAVIKPRLRELLPSRAEWRESTWPIARGSVLGFLIGILPGSAHIIASFVSYAVEKRVSRRPQEFGHGAVAGVAGPESANNSATSGAFVPMLALGVPSGPIPAVMLAAMMVHGVSPGPLLIKQQPELFWGFIASMYVGNVVLLILNLPLVGVFVNLLRVPYPLLYPAILIFCVLGVYAVNGSAVDVGIMTAMGALGYVLRKFDFETAPVVLGLILAPMMEMSFRQSLSMSSGNYTIFVNRPIALVMLMVGLGLLLLGIAPFVMKKLDWRDKLGVTAGQEKENI